MTESGVKILWCIIANLFCERQILLGPSSTIPNKHMFKTIIFPMRSGFVRMCPAFPMPLKPHFPLDWATLVQSSRFKSSRTMIFAAALSIQITILVLRMCRKISSDLTMMNCEINCDNMKLETTLFGFLPVVSTEFPNRYLLGPRSHVIVSIGE